MVHVTPIARAGITRIMIQEHVSSASPPARHVIRFQSALPAIVHTFCTTMTAIHLVLVEAFLQEAPACHAKVPA